MPKKPQHIYISGPMRGKRGFNFPAFFEAEEYVRTRFPDADICNPAREDIVRFRLQKALATDPSGLTAGCYLQDHPDLFTSESLRTALGHDLEYICRHADLLVMLPGWQKSKGALAEVAAAQALGVAVVEFDGGAQRPVEPLAQDPAVVEWAEALKGRENGPQRPTDPKEEVRTTSATGGQKGT